MMQTAAFQFDRFSVDPKTSDGIRSDRPDAEQDFRLIRFRDLFRKKTESGYAGKGACGRGHPRKGIALYAG